jgi:hypothetical protein
MITHKVGKTTIMIETRGCTDCGTEFTNGWTFDGAGEIEVKIKNSTKQLQIPLCSNCARDRQVKAERRIQTI